MSTQMQEVLSMGDARKEVVRDIYQEEKELFGYQIELKDALRDWLDSNLEVNNDYLYGLIDRFDVSSSKAPMLLKEIESHVKDLSLDEEKRQQLEDFLNALGVLIKAFEILRDFEISTEEIQQELADLKAEIVKPLRIKGERLNDVLSESSKVTLESLMSTREYQQFKKRFLALRGVKNFLGEEEHDLDFDKNERYNIDADKLVKEVIGYMIDLGIVSKPEDLKKVFDEMKTVGGVFEYKQVGNAEVGKNALFIKVGDKIITIRGNYGTTDIKWMPGLLKAGVDKNLKEAATELGVSPQKLKELLNFDGRYGKIGEERLSMEVKQGETIEGKEFYYRVEFSPEVERLLKKIYGDRYKSEEGEYGVFRLLEGGKEIEIDGERMKMGDKPVVVVIDKKGKVIETRYDEGGSGGGVKLLMMKEMTERDRGLRKELSKLPEGVRKYVEEMLRLGGDGELRWGDEVLKLGDKVVIGAGKGGYEYKIERGVGEGRNIKIEYISKKEKSEVKVNDKVEKLLKRIYGDVYKPEEGEYGVFRLLEGGIVITAPVVKVVENGKELDKTEGIKLYETPLNLKDIKVLIDDETGIIKELVINDSDSTDINMFIDSSEEISHKDRELVRKFNDLPKEVVKFLDQYLRVNENHGKIFLKNKEIPLGSKVIFYKNKEGNIEYKIEEGDFTNMVEVEYYSENREGGDVDSEYKKHVNLPQELDRGIDISADKVLIDVDALESVIGVDVSNARIKGDIDIKDGKLLIPHWTGDIRILENPDGIVVEYKYGTYPLQLVYVDLKGKEMGPQSKGESGEEKYEIEKPEAIDILDKLKDILDYVERNKLVLVKLNIFDEYYNFINAYKKQNWKVALKNLDKMLNSYKAKKFGLEDPRWILEKLHKLGDIDLIYALSLFVKGTLSDEYLLGEDLNGSKLDQGTINEVGNKALEIKIKSFLEHINTYWGANIASKIKKSVRELGDKIDLREIDISASNRAIDDFLAVSWVYTKRRKEQGFSLIPHGLGDVLQGKELVIDDVVLKKKIIEKVSERMLRQILKNYGVDKYVDVDSLIKSEMVDLFVNGRLQKKIGDADVEIEVNGVPVYYLYGECINPTIGYRLTKVRVKRIKYDKSVILSRDVSSVKEGYRLLEEVGANSVEGYSSVSRGALYFKDVISEGVSQEEEIGSVNILRDVDERIFDGAILIRDKEKPVSQEEEIGSVNIGGQEKLKEFNTIDVVPDQGTDWLYAIGEVEYKRNPHEEPPTGPEDPETTPGEGDKPAPNPGDDIDE